MSEGEVIYFKYEFFIRDKESKIGNFAVGSGFMAIPRRLFQPLDSHVGEDFVLPMQTAIAGYKVIYEPEAISSSILHQTKAMDMLRSKVRVISKDLRGLFFCRAILSPFRYSVYAWGIISHKLLRWLVPYFLIAIFTIHLMLLDCSLYCVVLALEITFYALAVTGYMWQRKGKPPRVIGIPFSFCLINLAALVGVARFVIMKRSGRWEPIR